MNRTNLALVLTMALMTLATHSRAESPCLPYEPEVVDLKGVLLRRTYPGRPNYESTRKGDEPETYFYLKLHNRICTLEGKEPNAPVADVDFVQLILDRNGYARLRPKLGKTVTLRGTLSMQITGHHHAPLLLTVRQDEGRP